MKSYKFGFVIFLISIITVLLVIAGGYYIYINLDNKKSDVYIDQKLVEKIQNGVKTINDCVSLDPWLKDDCYINIAIQNNDLSICDMNIEGIVGFKDSCYLKFNEQKADLSICDKLSEDYQVVGCYSKVAAQTNNINICENTSVFTTTFNKEECYRGIAISSSNSSICEKISNDLGQSLCYLQSKNEIEKANITYCEKIKNTDQKFLCYNETAIGQSNLDYCKKIDSDYEITVYRNVTENLRDICVKNINDFLLNKKNNPQSY